jgi:hypothetical protein
VVDQHPNRDLPTTLARHQVRQVIPDRTIQFDLSAFDLLQHSGGGECLGDASDAMVEVGSHRAAAVEIGDACSALPPAVVETDLGGDAGQARFVDGRQRSVQRVGVEGGRHWIPFMIDGSLLDSGTFGNMFRK